MNKNEREWRRIIRLTQWRINSGWWLNVYLPITMFITVVFASIVFIIKRAGLQDLKISYLWLGYCVTLILGGIVGYLINRNRFFSFEDVINRLDDRANLLNRLGTAYNTGGPWPSVPGEFSVGLRWRKSLILAIVTLNLSLLLSIIWIPFYIYEGESTFTMEEPVSWNRVSEWIQTFRSDDTFDQPSLENFEDKLEELKELPKNEWYNQSSLEAGDNLREQFESSIKETSMNMEKVIKILDQSLLLSKMLTNSDSDNGESLIKQHNFSSSEIDRLQQELGHLLDQLDLGNPSLSSELLSELRQLDLSEIQQVGKEELERMLRQLQKGVTHCNKCVGMNSLDEQLADGGSNALADGGNAVLTGSGMSGISRGPGSLPLSFNKAKSEIGSTKIETIKNTDISRIKFGKVMGVSSGKPDVDHSSFVDPVESGNIKASGSGGEAVWRNVVVPKERDILKQYFK